MRFKKLTKYLKNEKKNKTISFHRITLSVKKTDNLSIGHSKFTVCKSKRIKTKWKKNCVALALLSEGKLICQPEKG